MTDMIDVPATVRAFVARAGTPVAIATAANGFVRIYAGGDLPESYHPDRGPAVILAVAGGSVNYSNQLIRASVQFRSFGDTDAEAIATDVALFESIHDRSNGMVVNARQETIGQLLRDPDTGWPYVLTTYGFWIRNPQA